MIGNIDGRLAGHVQRVLAVLIDGLLLLGLGIAILVMSATLIPAINNAYGFVLWMGSFVLVDVATTAIWGLSLGRLITGIRVVRISDGQAPGFGRVLVRVAVVIATGWLAPVFLGSTQNIGSFRGLPARSWWDRAARTVLVEARGRNGGATPRP